MASPYLVASSTATSLNYLGASLVSDKALGTHKIKKKDLTYLCNFCVESSTRLLPLVFHPLPVRYKQSGNTGIKFELLS